MSRDQCQVIEVQIRPGCITRRHQLKYIIAGGGGRIRYGTGMYVKSDATPSASIHHQNRGRAVLKIGSNESFGANHT
jgi:hypothetical protein